MNKLIDLAIRQKFWVLLVFLGVITAGSYAVTQLPIDAVPDITNVQVMVNTKTGPLGPEEIETTVTYPIETELSGIQGVEEIRSISKYGLSQVIVVFEEDMNLYFARQLIAERLSNLRGRLPNGIMPEMGPVSTGLGEVLMYAVRAKPGSALANLPEDARLRYLRTVQDWTIKPELKTVKGVAEVDSNGGYLKSIQINLDPNKMAAYGLSMERILESLNDVGNNRGGGYMEMDNKRFIIRSVGRFDTVDQLKNIPIRLYALSEPIRLGQIAEVREGNQPRVGGATYNGEETVLGTVLMRIGGNSRTVAEDGVARLEKIELPEGVEIKVLYSRGFLVDSTIHTVVKNLAEGAVLVIVILLLILGNLRAAIIVSLAIPVSMLFSLSGMLQTGISANLMSLGAIDFGLLVDASVVMIENIVRKMEHYGKPVLTLREKVELILEAGKEVAEPVVSGLLIIMMVYVPILTLTGVEGKMFRPMAATVLFALGASLIVAIILMPVLAYFFLKPPKVVKESFFFGLITRAYRPFLNLSLNKRWLMVTPTIIVGVLSILLFSQMGSDFIPQLDEGDMVVGTSRRADISLPLSIAEQKSVERVIKRFGEVETVFSRLGTPESATDPMGINLADTFVILKKDRKQWPVQKNGRIRTKAELFDAIRASLDKEVPGQQLSPTQPIEMRFNEMLEGSRADVTLRIFGPDLNQLLTLVHKAEGIVGKIDGVNEVAMDELIALRRSPVIDYKIDHGQLSSHGLHVSDVNRSFEAAMAGEDVGYFFERDLRFPIVLRMGDRFRNDPVSIGKIPVELAGGGVIPLSRLTKAERKEQVTTIARYNSKRYASVAIYLENRDVQSFVNEAKAKIASQMPLPDGFRVTWGGQFKNLEKARLKLMIIVPITLAIIFLIILRSFNDLPQTILIFNTIPFAATGGVVFLFLRGISFSISAAVGFIALTGIAILNGMVLVSFFNHLKAEGRDLREVVYEGTLMRLRPVLMTAMVASLGFIPMAFNTGLGSEVQRPLATVVIGGLVSATLLTLLLLPTMYLWLEQWKLKRKSKGD